MTTTTTPPKTTAALSLRARLTADLDRWVEVDEYCAVQLCSDGSLVLSCRDTEDDPDDGHAEAALSDLGLRVRCTGTGDGEDDQYVERFAPGDWRWVQ